MATELKVRARRRTLLSPALQLDSRAYVARRRWRGCKACRLCASCTATARTAAATRTTSSSRWRCVRQRLCCVLLPCLLKQPVGVLTAGYGTRAARGQHACGAAQGTGAEALLGGDDVCGACVVASSEGRQPPPWLAGLLSPPRLAPHTRRLTRPAGCGSGRRADAGRAAGCALARVRCASFRLARRR